MTDHHINIPRRDTQRATARDIYNHLRRHPEDLPNDAANRAGTGHYALVARLDGSESAVKITELTHGSFSIFPAIAHGAYASTGDYIGHGVILYDSDLTNDAFAGGAVERLRLVVMRIDRYQSKMARKQAAYDAIYAREGQ